MIPEKGTVIIGKKTGHQEGTGMIIDTRKKRAEGIICTNTRSRLIPTEMKQAVRNTVKDVEMAKVKVQERMVHPMKGKVGMTIHQNGILKTVTQVIDVQDRNLLMGAQGQDHMIKDTTVMDPPRLDTI